MSINGLKTKNGVTYQLSVDGTYDDTELRQLINQKVSKQAGYSLIANTEITRLSGISNYNDQSLRSDISNSLSSKVDKVDGYSLVSNTQIDRLSSLDSYDDSSLRSEISYSLSSKVDKLEGYSLLSDDEINRLAGLDNYDDSELRSEISDSMSTYIDKAILNVEIPIANDDDQLNVNILLSRDPDMIDTISLNNINNYDQMKVALDTEFIQLDENFNTIPLAYFSGTLVVTLTAQNTPGFDPKQMWYAKAVWSTGDATFTTLMTSFLYNGYCALPKLQTQQTENNNNVQLAVAVSDVNNNVVGVRTVSLDTNGNSTYTSQVINKFADYSLPSEGSDSSNSSL